MESVRSVQRRGSEVSSPKEVGFIIVTSENFYRKVIYQKKFTVFYVRVPFLFLFRLTFFDFHFCFRVRCDVGSGLGGSNKRFLLLTIYITHRKIFYRYVYP